MIRDVQTTVFFDTFTDLSRKRGLSPSMAAEDAGLNRSVITSWRKGRIPSTKTLDRLADYFGVTRQYLLDGFSVESKVGRRTEIHEKMQEVLSVATNVSSTDTRKERTKFESRSFVQFALGLLRIYCPNETDETLASELKISPNVVKALKDDCFDKVLVNVEWSARIYSLLEDKNVPQILENLERIQRIIKHQQDEAIISKMPQVIWDYMFLKRHDFEFVKPDKPHIDRHKDIHLVKLKDSGKHWIFSFIKFETNVFWRYQSYIQGQFKSINEIPDVERFIITLMHTPNSASSDELARLEREPFETYLGKMNVIFPNIKIFLLQINSTTGEIIKGKQVDLSPLTDLQAD